MLSRVSGEVANRLLKGITSGRQLWRTRYTPLSLICGRFFVCECFVRMHVVSQSQIFEIDAQLVEMQ